MSRQRILAASGAAVVAVAILLAVFAGDELGLTGRAPQAEQPPVAETPPQPAPAEETRQSDAEAPASAAPTGDMAGGQTAASQDASSEAAPDETTASGSTSSEPTSGEAVETTSTQATQQASEPTGEATTTAAPSAGQDPTDSAASTAASSEAAPATPETTGSSSQASSSQPGDFKASESQVSESPPGDSEASDTQTSEFQAGAAASGASVGVTIAVPSDTTESGDDGDQPTMELHDQDGAAAQQQAALPDTQLQSPPTIPPGFDVVRVEGNGDAVVAGSAHPGAVVTLMDGKVALTSVVADRNGNWVACSKSSFFCSFLFF